MGKTVLLLVFILPVACSSSQMGSTQTPLSAYPCTSGDCLPVGDLPGWKQIFTEDFTEPVLPGEWSECSLTLLECTGLPESYRKKWWAYVEGWPDTSRNGTYLSSRVLSVSDGVLDIFIHTENGVHMVAAVLPLINGNKGALGQLYGRYAIRFRAEALRGYKIAWLLWPDSETWPRDGEIDFPEGNLDGELYAFMHRQGATVGSDQDAFSSGVAAGSGWHTAVIEWTRESIHFLLDGRLLGTSTDRIPDTSMHWVIQTETSLDGFEPDDSLAGHIQVDWVAVYASLGK